MAANSERIRYCANGWSSTNQAAVGGIVLSVNIFAALSPSLAVIGLVACIGTVVLITYSSG